MYQRMIVNDFKKSRLISVSTLVFVAVSTMLLALAAMLAVNLTGAIDGLMRDAKTPHFMQMHSGDVDFARLEAFSESNAAVQAFQVMEFVNVEAIDITVQQVPFDGGVQDNGVIKQARQFDFLLDLDGEMIEPQAGEVYVPLTYMKNGSIKVGDLLEFYGQEFTVRGFLRDSQMNSPLSSSKRFLISDSDFEGIKSQGNMEYLISFRLNDLDALRAFEAQYVAAGLESNGPTLTYPLFRMINGLSDGLMIAVILLISFLVVMVTFLCIRFTLVARMEDDYREIGVLKAVGLYNRDIIGLYLAKYAVIAFVGCTMGYLASLVLRQPLLEDIKLSMGAYHQTGVEVALGITSALMIFAIVLGYVYLVLRRIRAVSVTEAIRFGAVQEQSQMYSKFLLSKSKLLSSNAFLAVKDILGRKKLYMTMMLILLIAIFMMTLPLSLYSTIASEHFVSYMGVGKSDLRIDIQQTTQIPEKANAIASAMEDDLEIEKHVVLTARSYVVRSEEGRESRLLIETGDHSIFPIVYSDGRMPIEPYEIALSAINAEDLGKSVGDNITIVYAGEGLELKICGVYSDITNGGKTAKAAFADADETAMWSVISANVRDNSELESVLERYSNAFTYAKVTGVREYVHMTFGSTIAALEKASAVGASVALFLTFLITLLFVKMLVAKDRYSIGIMKAIGYNNADIGFQFVLRTLLVSIVSICLGIVLTLTLGELFAGLMIASFGVTSLSLEVNGLFTFIIGPVLMLMVVHRATIIGTKSTQTVKITQSIKE